MARVYNWQIGREMSYWYPERRPKQQFAAVFDINKCIACQTCTLACKTTWTSGKGQEYMLWNNVETKPYGFYPLAWDLKLLEQARRAQTWDGRHATTARRIFEAAPAGERVLGWRPGASWTTRTRTSARTTAPGTVDSGARLRRCRTLTWFFYLARICNHCTYPGLPGRRARAARSTSGPRTASCWSTRSAAAATRSASRPARTRRSSSTR